MGHTVTHIATVEEAAELVQAFQNTEVDRPHAGGADPPCAHGHDDLLSFPEDPKVIVAATGMDAATPGEALGCIRKRLGPALANEVRALIRARGARSHPIPVGKCSRLLAAVRAHLTVDPAGDLMGESLDTICDGMDRLADAVIALATRIRGLEHPVLATVRREQLQSVKGAQTEVRMAPSVNLTQRAHPAVGDSPLANVVAMDGHAPRRDGAAGLTPEAPSGGASIVETFSLDADDGDDAEEEYCPTWRKAGARAYPGDDVIVAVEMPIAPLARLDPLLQVGPSEAPVQPEAGCDLMTNDGDDVKPMLTACERDEVTSVQCSMNQAGTLSGAGVESKIGDDESKAYCAADGGHGSDCDDSSTFEIGQSRRQLQSHRRLNRSWKLQKTFPRTMSNSALWRTSRTSQCCRRSEKASQTKKILRKSACASALTTKRWTCLCHKLRGRCLSKLLTAPACRRQNRSWKLRKPSPRTGTNIALWRSLETRIRLRKHRKCSKYRCRRELFSDVWSKLTMRRGHKQSKCPDLRMSPS